MRHVPTYSETDRAEAEWLSKPANLRTLLTWMEEHAGETFTVDGESVEVLCPSNVDEFRDYLDKPWHWAGELRAMTMQKALENGKRESEHFYEDAGDGMIAMDRETHRRLHAGEDPHAGAEEAAAEAGESAFVEATGDGDGSG